jgi:hypothetical protein
MSVQLLPWPGDSNYFRDLVFHLREPVMLPQEKFELWDYVGTVYTIRSRNTNGPEITRYECCLNFELEGIIRLTDNIHLYLILATLTSTFSHVTTTT